MNFNQDINCNINTVGLIHANCYRIIHDNVLIIDILIRRDADRRLERAAQAERNPSTPIAASRPVPSTSPRGAGGRQRAYRHDKENTDVTRRQPIAALTLQQRVAGVAGVAGVEGRVSPSLFGSGADKLPVLARKSGVLIRAKVPYKLIYDIMYRRAYHIWYTR